jgi:hypothetical protein
MNKVNSFKHGKSSLESQRSLERSQAEVRFSDLHNAMICVTETFKPLEQEGYKLELPILEEFELTRKQINGISRECLITPPEQWRFHGYSADPVFFHLKFTITLFRDYYPDRGCAFSIYSSKYTWCVGQEVSKALFERDAKSSSQLDLEGLSWAFGRYSSIVDEAVVRAKEIEQERATARPQSPAQKQGSIWSRLFG